VRSLGAATLEKFNADGEVFEVKRLAAAEQLQRAQC